MTKQEFLVRITKAIEIAKQKKAILNGMAVTVQAALESGWGNSALSALHNNLFGIKAATDWDGPTRDYGTYEEVAGKSVWVPKARWAVFPSWNECLVYYSGLIQRRWYFQDALPFADPPEGNGNDVEWIKHLLDKDAPHEMAWATSSSYLQTYRRVKAAVEDLKRGA